MSFGLSSLGTMAFGLGGDSGPDPVRIVATAIALNAVSIELVDLSMTDEVIGLDPYDVESWTLSGPNAPLVQAVERTGDFTVTLFLDALLTEGETYEVTYLVADESDDFVALMMPVHERRGDVRVTGRWDLANPQYVADALGNVVKLGTLQLSATGDYANETGIPYLRKRVVRRLTTLVDSFVDLPGYGLGLRLKRILKPSEQLRLQGDAIRQVKQERDVASASVGISQPKPGRVLFAVKLTTTSGETADFEAEMTIGGSGA